jgi:hypothetical protein
LDSGGAAGEKVGEATLELGLNEIFWDVSFYRLHFGIHCDTNGCTDFTDFTDAVRIFLNPNALFRAKNKKNPYRVREIRSIRTSIRITRYPKV